MKTATIKEIVMLKAILAMFVDGRINTQSDVDVIMSKIQKNLNMSAVHACEFFRNAIGTNN